MSFAQSDVRAAVLMIGTSPDTQGGVSTVVREMLSSSLSGKFRIRYVVTHRDGGRWAKLVASVQGIWTTWTSLALRPALLHVHLASRASFWRKLIAIAPAWCLRVPVLVHLHGAEFQRFYADEAGPLGRWVIRRVMCGSACVVGLSRGWKDWLTATFPGAYAVVIENSVALPVPSPAAKAQQPLVLFLGRLGERKGSNDLVRALALLSDLPVGPRVVIAGDGDLGSVRALADELGVAAQVDTPGWVGPERKARLLREAVVYVLPSYNEGLPMSVLEAMSYGLPVVSTPVGGIPDAITDGVEGFLVPPGDVPTLAARLRALLEDAELARSMGLAAREKVEACFATDSVSQRWCALYAELGVPGSQSGAA